MFVYLCFMLTNRFRIDCPQATTRPGGNMMEELEELEESSTNDVSPSSEIEPIRNQLNICWLHDHDQKVLDTVNLCKTHYEIRE